VSSASELHALKQEFLEYIEIERGRSFKTVENYGRCLSRFLSHTGASIPQDITEGVVGEFRLWLNKQEARPRRCDAHGEALKKKTQNCYLIALRAFLKYLRERGVTSLGPERIELAKVGDRSLDLITDTELTKLLNAPEGNGLLAMRDRALIELLLSTGLRVSELCALNSDIDLSRDKFPVRGKGGKVRVVFLSQSAKEAVRRYRAARKDMDRALFVNNGKRTDESGSTRLTPRSVQRIIKYYAAKAGITRKVTPHALRHSFTADLLGNGADLCSVQTFLGHANISTTEIYAHATDAHLKEAHKRSHRKKRH